MTESDIRSIEPSIAAAALRGVSEAIIHTGVGIEPRRFPAAAEATTHALGIDWISRMAAGVRLDLTTTASAIELEVLSSLARRPGGPPSPGATFAVDCDGIPLQAFPCSPALIEIAGPSTSRPPGPLQTLRVSLPRTGTACRVRI